MNSRERVLATLNHQEPDRVPFDIGSTGFTGIHEKAYKNLLEYLGIERDVNILHAMQQIAWVDEDILTRFNVDVRQLFAIPTGPPPEVFIEGDCAKYYDEFNIKWRKPLKGGFYFDMEEHPFANFTTIKEVEDYKFPDPTDSARFVGMRERAQAIVDNTGAAIAMTSITTGIVELSCWLRGMENFMMDIALNRKLAEAILDKVLEYKVEFWKETLSLVGDLVDVVTENDDLGTQNSQLFSPKHYHEIIKPRHRILFDTIKKAKPDAFLFFHSCGSVHKLIPDFIDLGIDILNPVQVTAKNMDTKKLKKEFGKDITFWGGGADPINILNVGTPEQVTDEVRRRIDDMAAGGGFVFATVHNIQADVPPQNIIAMYEALRKYGVYK